MADSPFSLTWQFHSRSINTILYIIRQYYSVYFNWISFMTFGMKLRELREAKGLSQKGLADATGLTQASISRWEAGLQIPAFDDALTLCNALGVKCTAFNGVDFSPAEEKRGRGRPAEPKKKRKEK